MSPSIQSISLVALEYSCALIESVNLVGEVREFFENIGSMEHMRHREMVE